MSKKWSILQETLHAKEQLLKERSQHLNHAQATNKYLAQVKSHYQTFYNELTREKQAELESIRKLQEYTQRLSAQNNQQATVSKQLEKDQQNIMAEINRLQAGIQELMK